LQSFPALQSLTRLWNPLELLAIQQAFHRHVSLLDLQVREVDLVATHEYLGRLLREASHLSDAVMLVAVTVQPFADPRAQVGSIKRQYDFYLLLILRNEFSR
jgi:hypothetical protein